MMFIRRRNTNAKRVRWQLARKPRIARHTKFKISAAVAAARSQNGERPQGSRGASAGLRSRGQLTRRRMSIRPSSSSSSSSSTRAVAASGGGAWGGPVAASAAAAAVKLHDVMDEELASKLQREEEEQWELEIAGRFGDERRGGWCFVEVPSTDCELGVMSVIQQEISVESEQDELREDDPDYAFALELQAQEAEEYDRMRRQQVSSMERIRVIHQEDPHRGEIQKTLERYYSSDGQLVFEGVRDDHDDPGTGGAAADELRVVPMAEPVATVAASHLERLHLRDMNVHRDIYIDGDDFGLPKQKMNSLSAALKQSDRKHRRARKSAPFKQA